MITGVNERSQQSLEGPFIPTSKDFSLKSRRFFITIENPVTVTFVTPLVAYFEKMKAWKYTLVGMHDKPNPHYHIYIEYSNASLLSRKQIAKIIGVNEHTVISMEKAVAFAFEAKRYMTCGDDHDRHIGVTGTVVYERGHTESLEHVIYKNLQKSFEETMIMEPHITQTETKVILFYNRDAQRELSAMWKYILHNQLLSIHDITETKSPKGWREYMVINSTCKKQGIDELRNYHFKYIFVPKHKYDDTDLSVFDEKLFAKESAYDEDIKDYEYEYIKMD